MNLVDGHVEILIYVVDWTTAVRAVPGRPIRAHGKENALGTRLERNLAETPDGVLPQRDHG